MSVKSEKKRRAFRVLRALVTLHVLLAVLLAFSVNSGIVLSAEGDILPENSDFSGYDCIIVFGCGINPDGTPSHMLYDRVITASQLYLSMADSSDGNDLPVILMSGDGKDEGYNEPQVMKDTAIEAGAPEAAIVTDTLGLSTFDTLRRAGELVSFEKAILITQEYHLYRALFIADSLGIEAVGVSADRRSYSGQVLRDLREAAARVKDFFKAVFS